MAPQLEALQAHKPYFRLRKIDINDWNSPVARQNEIRSIPALRLNNGKELVSNDTQEIVKLLNDM